MQRYILAILILTTTTHRLSSTVAAERRLQHGVAESRLLNTAQPGYQPARDSRPATGNSRIYGRVLVGNTAVPARHALVRLTSPSLRDPRTAMTDQDGRYVFPNLPSGTYSMSVRKDGFLSSSYGQTRPTMAAQTLRLSEDQSAEGIDLFLFRGGAISGVVVDEFGEPAANVSVTVLRSQFQRGKRQLVAAGPRASTNDLGEYRVFALPPGAYYVTATLPPNPPPIENGIQLLDEDPFGLSPVFFPGTPDPALASTVSLTPGESVSGVNMALVATPLASASGVATNQRGAPMTAGTISAIPRGMAQNGFARATALRPDGTFRITGLPPGEYTLLASSRVAPQAAASAAAALPRPDVATATVSINGGNVDGIHLAPLFPVTVSGRVIFDNPQSAGSVRASAIRVSAATLNSDDAMVGLMGSPITPADDLRFTLHLPPTAVMLRATISAGGQSSWTVKAVHVNGTDVTDTGIALRPREDISDVTIELTDRAPKVSGMVTVADAPAAGYHVIVFPQDQDRWLLSGPGLFLSTRTDANGAFSLTGLRAGRFYAAALLDIDELGWTDPDFLKDAVRRATGFTVASGEQKALDLRAQ
jgi:hypothetical protein